MSAYFVHNFNKFKLTIVIFDKQHREHAAKLLIQKPSYR